jgi:hypothetical protein
MECFCKRFKSFCDDGLRIDGGFSYNSQVLEAPQLFGSGSARKTGNGNPDLKLGRGEWE